MASETCAPDCAERTACPVVGEPGHWQCGTCPKHKEPRHHCGCLAAPSPVGTTEPPAETPTQPDRDTGYGQPEAECRRVHRFSPETGWASREEMINGGRMVCGCGSVFFHHTGPGRWSCGRCGQPPRQPPAETQQDDEHKHVWWNGADRPYYCRSCGEPRPTRAARPSADTEALDRMRAAVERAIPVDVVPRINFDWLMRDLRAALDGGR